MKLIKAYIRRRKIQEVYYTLKSEGFCCMTFVECEGTGRYSDREKEHISQKYPFADAYKVLKIELLISSSEVERVVSIIRKTARTGYKGDGMVMVSPVEEVYKIRTDDNKLELI